MVMTPLSFTFFSVSPKSCVSAGAARPRNKAAVITSPIECLMSLLLSCCACMHRSSNLFRRRVDRLTETLHDHLDCAVVDDEWRRNKHVIAVHAVNRAAHGIHHQSAGHRFTLNARMHLQFRLECLLGAAVGDKLYGLVGGRARAHRRRKGGCRSAPSA